MRGSKILSLPKGTFETTRFQVGLPAVVEIAKVLDTAKRAGYGGALVWSVLGGDEASAYPPDLVVWAQTHASTVGDTRPESGSL